jgi:uncharacterized protein YrrD
MPGYAGYNARALDAAEDIILNLSGQHFLMLVNVEAVHRSRQITSKIAKYRAFQSELFHI